MADSATAATLGPFTFMNKLNTAYAKEGFFGKYFGSFAMTCVLLLVFFVLISYYYVKIRAAPIRKNWAAERCKPSVIPFAGIINPPKDGSSAFASTQQNFVYCMNNMVADIAGFAVEPLNLSFSVLSDLYKEILDAMNDARKMMAYIRTQYESVSRDVFARILSILIPIQQLIIKVKDIFGKSKATMVSAIYTLFGSYLTLASAIGAIYELIVIILIALAATILILWIVPFTWGVAASMTAVFVSILVPLSIVAAGMADIFDIHGSPLPGVPSRPACFGGNTIVRLRSGRGVKMVDVKNGDVLADGGVVTGLFKHTATGSKIYKLGNTYVTAEHRVRNHQGWIPVSEHPAAVPVPPLSGEFTDRYLYCLNTTTKQFVIEGRVYKDWDDMYPGEYGALAKIVGEHVDASNLAKYFDNGFDGDFCVDVCGYGEKPIRAVKIGDRLAGGEEVLGVVRLTGGKHHLITNTGRFGANNRTYFDYSFNLDKYL
jgi:hypothetical protein